MCTYRHSQCLTAGSGRPDRRVATIVRATPRHVGRHWHRTPRNLMGRAQYLLGPNRRQRTIRHIGLLPGIEGDRPVVPGALVQGVHRHRPRIRCRHLGIVTLPVAAFLGALIPLAVTIVVSVRVNSVTAIVLVGVASSMVFSSLVTFVLLVLGDVHQLGTVMQSLACGFGDARWTSLIISPIHGVESSPPLTNSHTKYAAPSKTDRAVLRRRKRTTTTPPPRTCPVTAEQDGIELLDDVCELRAAHSIHPHWLAWFSSAGPEMMGWCRTSMWSHISTPSWKLPDTCSVRSSPARTRPGRSRWTPSVPVAATSTSPSCAATL
uniref:Uncharacterized protein n=1 Tax=Rhodococcus sp. NS1 TaxID=402236 RepID=A0A097SQB7_9NOCA|nr:hypothetical protein LRS1606.278 [Rhodococcus sp. NS1]